MTMLNTTRALGANENRNFTCASCANSDVLGVLKLHTRAIEHKETRMHGANENRCPAMSEINSEQ